jgi:AcrR family transcriptional regulator
MFKDEKLSPTKEKTLRKLVDAGLRLYKEDKFPQAEEITQEADKSKNTFYKYFSNQDVYVEYLIKEVLGREKLPDLTKNDVSANVEQLLKWGYQRLDEHRALARDALRLSQEQWAGRIHAQTNEGFLREKSNRREILEEVFAPLRESLPAEDVDRLVRAVAVLYGTEAMVVLTDMFGMSRDEITKLTTWMAVSLLKLSQEKNGS